MATPKTADEIKSEIFTWLNRTRYASNTLEILPGGAANFIYRAQLSQPLSDGTTEVLIKHGEGYMAKHPANKISTERCRIEEECLKALTQFRNTPNPENTFNYVVRTPKCYLYDETTHTQIQEYLPNSLNLRTYILQHFASPTPASLRPQCYELGKALGEWITGFYRKGSETKLYEEVKGNKEMQALKHMINYDWLLQRIDQFPGILEGARDVFVKVKEKAANELDGELTPIHGDFWPGNIVLPNTAIQEGAEIPVLIIDWEMAQFGVQAMDHGEMIGELYALWLYDKTDAALWMVQGYAEGLREQREASVWRIAVQVGVHLLSFGALHPGRGTLEQVEEVARLGRDFIVNGWEKNREWFEESELRCLFTKSHTRRGE